MDSIVVAAAQYRIDFLGTFEAFEHKLDTEVAQGAASGAQLLVFPEYGSMELASLFPADVYRSLPAQLEALQTLVTPYRELVARLARAHGVYVLASSIPVRMNNGSYRNRAFLFSPSGREGFQDKLLMTRFENEQWGVSAGDELRVFETELGRIGIDVCYDVEFPLLARAQVEAGADVILAPSCTDTDAGYHRVRIGSQARALENQCHVVQAVTVGEARWSEAVDVNKGAAAVYTPVDRGFPADGVVAMGRREEPGWVCGRVEVARARSLRTEGQVLNYRDWPGQMRSLASATILVPL